MRRLLVVLSSAGVLLVGSAPIAGAAAPYCRSGQAPQFVFGFAALAQAGAPMGTALECEHANPANGDTLQQTSTGLSFYRKSTNTPTFTDGYNHWALTATGLVTWTGTSIDPPATSSSVPIASPVPLAPTSKPGFPRQEAISAATEQAKHSVPEQEMRDVRIDAATAELITLEEVNRRLDLQSPNGYGRGQDPHTPMWWVSVRGSFTYAGMAPAGGGRPAVYEASERIVIYDANTGERMGDVILSSQRLTPVVMPGTGP